MSFNHLTIGHMMVLLSEFDEACRKLPAAVAEPDRQHKLPGLLMDCNEALAAIINHAGGADPAIAQALANGVRSTHDIRPPPDFGVRVIDDHIAAVAR